MRKSIGLTIFILILAADIPVSLCAQMNLPIRDDEEWFGGAVNDAHLMPFKEGYSLNMNGNTRGNQAAPFLISTKGRFVWSEEPFRFHFEKNSLIIDSSHASLTVDSVATTLHDAYKRAASRFFPAKNKMPDSILFARPQYNTWIELVYNQNQRDILHYAKSIIDNGFPPGVLMIDDNWADYYGRFDFRKDRFADAAGMIDSLHAMGFKVMLWVCPFVSPDTEVFRELAAKKMLLLTSGGDTALSYGAADKPALISWWNGYSAVLDFSNPDAKKWYTGRLSYMMKTYHIDGFKFDAGDADFYPANALSFARASPNEQSRLWGDVGLAFFLNEYRAMWKMGGEPLVERLRDKQHSWTDLQKLIPHITLAGLLGYQFTCPDMIGGGEFGSFRDIKTLDEELIVRSAECSALMPMMQFSVAPWRVLSSAHLAIVQQTVQLRRKYTSYILQLAREASITGEPIVRSMEYAYPGQLFSEEKGEFMLGSKYLVAPVLTRDGVKMIHLPKGTWRDDRGKIFKGPQQFKQVVPLDRLLIFELIK